MGNDMGILSSDVVKPWSMRRALMRIFRWTGEPDKKSLKFLKLLGPLVQDPKLPKGEVLYNRWKKLQTALESKCTAIQKMQWESTKNYYQYPNSFSADKVNKQFVQKVWDKAGTDGRRLVTLKVSVAATSADWLESGSFGTCLVSAGLLLGGFLAYRCLRRFRKPRRDSFGFLPDSERIDFTHSEMMV